MAQRRYDLTEDGTITETGISTADRTHTPEEGSC